MLETLTANQFRELYDKCVVKIEECMDMTETGDYCVTAHVEYTEHVHPNRLATYQAVVNYNNQLAFRDHVYDYLETGGLATVEGANYVSSMISALKADTWTLSEGFHSAVLELLTLDSSKLRSN